MEMKTQNPAGAGSDPAGCLPLEQVTAQRDMLAHYIRQCSEIDHDLCFPEVAAGRCPYRCHYGPVERAVCTACIIRNAEKLEQLVQWCDDTLEI